jgi:Filamin/ABP280 repeat
MSEPLPEDADGDLPPPPPLAEGQIIVAGSPAPAPRKKKVINLLNRSPSPVILEDYGDLEASRCTVGGPGVAGGIVGLPTQVTVTARDAAGVRIREGGHHFKLFFQHCSNGAIPKTYESIDHGDGAYSFPSVRADLKGMHQVRASADLGGRLPCCPGPSRRPRGHRRLY